MENVKYIPGDLVIYQGQICEVKGSILHYTKLLYNVKDNMVDAESLQGLPLTPQILEANGWKPDGEWLRFRTGKAYIYICESSSQRGTYLVCVGDNKYFIACISYIHQLQHLLFGLGLDSSLKV